MLQKPVPVYVVPVTEEKSIKFIGANGTSEASTAVDVSFPSLEIGTKLRVQEIKAKIGDSVEKGEIIAVLQNESLEEEINRHQNNLSTITSKLGIARKDVKEKRGYYSAVENLFSKGFATKSELESVRTAMVNAEIEEKRYQQELLDTKSVLNRLSSSLTELELKSPTEGIVLERKVEEGEVRSAGEGFFSIGEISPLHVVADVSQEDKDGTFLEQEAEVSFNFLPGKTFTGKVTRIDPGVDIETQTFKVTISIPNEVKSLSPGSAAFVRFNAKSDSIVIPRHAVIGIPDDPAVYVLDDDNTVDLRKIVLGTALPPGKIEVIEGLREGEKVVTTNIKFLKQGSLVSISDDTVFQ